MNLPCWCCDCSLIHIYTGKKTTHFLAKKTYTQMYSPVHKTYRKWSRCTYNYNTEQYKCGMRQWDRKEPVYMIWLLRIIRLHTSFFPMNNKNVPWDSGTVHSVCVLNMYGSHYHTNTLLCNYRLDNHDIFIKSPYRREKELVQHVAE